MSEVTVMNADGPRPVPAETDRAAGAEPNAVVNGPVYRVEVPHPVKPGDPFLDEHGKRVGTVLRSAAAPDGRVFCDVHVFDPDAVRKSTSKPHTGRPADAVRAKVRALRVLADMFERMADAVEQLPPGSDAEKKLTDLLNKVNF